MKMVPEEGERDQKQNVKKRKSFLKPHQSASDDMYTEAKMKAESMMKGNQNTGFNTKVNAIP